MQEIIEFFQVRGEMVVIFLISLRFFERFGNGSKNFKFLAKKNGKDLVFPVFYVFKLINILGFVVLLSLGWHQVLILGLVI